MSLNATVIRNLFVIIYNQNKLVKQKKNVKFVLLEINTFVIETSILYTILS